MGISFNALAVAVTVAIIGSSAWGHGDQNDAKQSKHAAKAEQMPFGIAGDPKRVSRTVNLEMSDEMRFFPAALEVKQGDTVRFVLKNRGKIMHEMVIGTMAGLKEHAVLMKKFPDMEHAEPYMAHVKPSGTGSIVWNFNRVGEFNYACLVAGHFEAGMVGKVTVK